MALLPRLLPLLPILAMSLAMGACANGGGGGALAGNGPFRLMPQESARLAPDVVLTLESVSDSRCPPGAKCVWAGQLEYRFRLQRGDSVDTFSLAPDKTSHASRLLPGARIELDRSAVPPAGEAQAQGASAHAVVIRLARP
jgi:hypothetical protein